MWCGVQRRVQTYGMPGLFVKHAAPLGPSLPTLFSHHDVVRLDVLQAAEAGRVLTGVSNPRRGAGQHQQTPRPQQLAAPTRTRHGRCWQPEGSALLSSQD